PAAGLSETGLPLGEYQLSLSGEAGTPSPQFIWVTPTAVYYGATSQTLPTGFTTKVTDPTPLQVTP
ncbi:MAG TPA: hypothetical protein VGS21_12140, partial [Acidimicrobiales bacterium]|nr:hypothetical protein [Acidimicrobiales bacterium]